MYRFNDPIIFKESYRRRIVKLFIRSPASRPKGVVILIMDFPRVIAG